MTIGQPERDWALRLARDYVAGTLSFRQLHDELSRANEELQKTFPDDDPDTDVSPFLVAVFVTALSGLSSQVQQRRVSEEELVACVRTWLPHLERGQGSWERQVRSGNWPIK
jgi:hypothetical protein